MKMSLAGVLIMLQVLATSAQAQPLADRVPENALVYVGWRGIDSMGPGYDGSHFKAVLEACEPGGFFDQFVPSLIERIAKEDAESAEQVQLVADIGRLAWRYPTAFCFGRVIMVDPANPVPQLGFVCQAGDDADKLVAKLNTLIEEEGPPAPIRFERHGELLVITIGDEMSSMHDLAADRAAGACLADNAGFKAALAQVHESPVMTVYTDIQGFIAEANQIMVVANPMVAMFWPQISQVLGVNGLERVVSTSGFDGADWDQRMFVASPAPRAGLIGKMGSEPVSDDILKVVPQSAAMVSVGRADMSGLLGSLRESLSQINPAFPDQFDAAKQQATQMLGVDLDTEFFQALGPEWAVYTDRGIAGTGLLGLVAVNPLRDPAAVERSMATISKLATTLIAQQMQNEEITIEFRQTQVGDMTIHYLATPAVAPSWGVKDGNLYLALYPQAVAAAASHVSAGSPNLLANDQFIAMRKRLGDVKASKITFMDLPQTAPKSYETAMLVSRLYLGMADIFGVAAPAMLLPPLPDLMAHTSPSGSVSWTDDNGYHMRAVSPFPGSQALGMQNSLVVSQTAMMAGIMLPALSAARRTARQMQSSTHARGIHQGCIFYAQAHDRQLPNDIGVLVLDEYFTVEYTLSPMSGKTAPDGFDSWSDQDKRKWINQNTSYVLVPDLRVDNDSEKIVLFTKLQDSGGKGISVCWNDNHVTFEPVDRARQLILEQTGKSLEEWSSMIPQPAPEPK